MQIAIGKGGTSDITQILGVTLSSLGRCKKAPLDWLDDDIAWFACRSWNHGIALRMRRHRTEAMQVCSLAMKFLPFISETKRAPISGRMTSTFPLVAAANAGVEHLAAKA